MIASNLQNDERGPVYGFRNQRSKSNSLRRLAIVLNM